VLIMIEAHLVDSWTGEAARGTATFARAMILGGFGAPLFLLLAGVSVSLSAGSKLRRTGDRRGAAVAVMRRGLEIFLLAFLFRLQAWILGWASPRTLLRVDILNIMGPAIVICAAIWGAGGTPRARALVLLAATLAIAFLTPPAWVTPWLSVLPDPVEAYLRPTGGMTSFAIMPWAGFVAAGALLGVLLDSRLATGERRSEARLNLTFATAGVVLAVGSYAAAAALPSLYSASSFWTTSPSYFFLRVGVLTSVVGLAYWWERRPSNRGGWSPVRQLGRTSLFIYWIHVEMIYGLVSLPIHHALTLTEVGVALALFTGFMLACSLGKDRIAGWWAGRRPALRAAGGAS
jgi:uncharacterized membrane protein